MSRENSRNRKRYQKRGSSGETEEFSPGVTSIPVDIENDKVIRFFNNNPPGNTNQSDSQNISSNTLTRHFSHEDSLCPRCADNPQFIARSSKDSEFSVFGNSVKLDGQIVEKLAKVLSNQVLRKESEAEYFSEMNLFDQEWEFPFNKRHFEMLHLLENIQASPLEIKLDLYKKSLIDLQMQLRSLSDFFVKVDRERIYFRQKLISVLQKKVSQLVEVSPELKAFVKSLSKPNSLNQESEIAKLKKENKESQSLFVNLKRRNVNLEEEVKQLKKKLKEKRTQLKKYMFRKDMTGEDHNNTRTTTNSNTQGISADHATLSKDVPNKFLNRRTPQLAQMKNLKCSSTILSQQNKQGSLLKAKNRSQIQLNTSKGPKVSIHENQKEPEGGTNAFPNFLQDSLNNYQKAFGNADRRRGADRASIKTEAGTVEIPGMLLNLQSQRKSRLVVSKEGDAPVHERRHSGFKLLHEMGKTKLKSNLGSKLLQIKKRNSKLVTDQNTKNPFIFKKVPRWFS